MLLTILYGVVGVAAFLFFAVVAFGYYYRYTAGMANTSARMDGKTVIVTGGSDGIGKEAARDMARRGARVVLACRNMEKGARVAADIIGSTGNKQVVVNRIDTSSLASVRAFAAEILAQEKKIDVLILNAGVGGLDERNLTSDGFEITMATNHFGHFLLGNLLLGRVKESSPSRIVVVSSDSFLTTFDPDNLNFEKGDFGPYRSYCQSKSCNILFGKRLADMLAETGVVVNSLNPGLVNTTVFGKSGGIFVGQLFRIITPYAGKTVEQGAQTINYLAAAEEAGRITGKFFENCKESDLAVDLLKNDGLGKKVWEKSETLVKLQAHEKHF